MKTIPPPCPPRSLAAFLAPPKPPPLPIRSPLIDYLEDLVASGGPEPAEYGKLNAAFREIADRGARIPDGHRFLAAARASLAPTLLKGTLHGFAHLRPHGYDGDFELIERILSFHHSVDQNLVRWDRYCHSLPLTCALRSRKHHLWNLLRRLEAEGEESLVRTLNFRSGPAREFTDYFAATGSASRIQCDCLDPDINAAIHGRRMTARMTNRMSFHTQPLLAFKSEHPYWLVWSSILAEALDDRALVVILRRMLHLLEPGGQLVLAQLSPGDNSGAFLEVVTGWRLQRRDADELESLALEAGAYPDMIRVQRDPAHPNLYLHVGRPLGRLRRRVRPRERVDAAETPEPPPGLARIDFTGLPGNLSSVPEMPAEAA